jgi:LysR family transcriptional regulator of gallate degradation
VKWRIAAASRPPPKLEAILGAPLFQRQSRGMFLSEPGALFRKRAERALQLIDSGARLVSQARSRDRAREGTDFGHLITSTQLRALIAVAQHGNFSVAARSIGVSQPSLYRVARHIERISGAEFYRRDPHGIHLTEYAESLVRCGRLAFAELRQGFEEIDLWRGIDSTLISIGTLPLARSVVLPSAINEITTRRPGIAISVVDGPYDDLLHALRHGEIDLMIGALRDPVPIDDVVQEALFHDPLAIYAGPSHPLARRKRVTARELVSYPWVVPRQGTPTRTHFDRLFRDWGVDPPNTLVESSSLVLIRGLLSGSRRLTLISTHQVREEEKLGLVSRLPVQLSDTERAIGMTTRRDWLPTSAQFELIESLRTLSVSLSRPSARLANSGSGAADPAQ